MAFTGSRLQRETVTMILAGGEGNRLFPLTGMRTNHLFHLGVNIE